MVRDPFKKRVKKLNGYDYVIMLIVLLLLALIIIPLMNVIAISFSSNEAVLKDKNMLIPVDFTPNAYLALFKSPGVWRGLLISIFITLATTILHLVLTVMMGYVLSRPNLPLKKLLTAITLVTMIFSGGLVPTYKVISSLGLLDTLTVLIVPGCVSAYSVLLMRNFIEQIPNSVKEAAIIDGAGPLQVLFHVIVPMSKPIIATLAVFCAVGKWNDWTSAFMYINKNTQYYPLQNIIKDIAVSLDTSALTDIDLSASSYAFQMATIVFGSLPIILVYPFLTKYFEKGIYLGSEK